MNNHELIEQASEQQLRDTLHKINTTLDQYDHTIWLGMDAPGDYINGMTEIINAVTGHIKEKTKPEPPPLHMLNYDTLINTAEPGVVTTTLRRVAKKLASTIDYYENDEDTTMDDFDSGRHSGMLSTLAMIKEELERKPDWDEKEAFPTIPIIEINGLLESLEAMIDMGTLKPEAKTEGAMFVIGAVNDLIYEYQQEG